MTASIYTSLLAQGNTGNEILQILDTLMEEITEANIAFCAEVFTAN
jgi:hypothetical protein